MGSASLKRRSLVFLSNKMQNNKKLSDTQPRFSAPPPSSPDSPSSNSQQPKPSKSKGSIGWVALTLFALVTSLFLGAWLGYRSAEKALLQAQFELSSASLDTQFALGIQDLEAGRIALAKQRFEFIVQHDPSYPGITEKLVTVYEVLLATGTPPPAASATPIPTIDQRPVQDLFNHSLLLAGAGDWSSLLDTLSSLRKADRSYQATRVDGLMYLALRSRGIEKILKQGNLGGGSYDLALAERFGPLDVDASTAREWARLFMIGLSFWEVYPDQAVFYFGQVASAAPYLMDSSGWTATDRYFAALIQYGDALVAKEAFCDAATQYQLAFSIRADADLQKKLEDATLKCQGVTETPAMSVTPTVSETPTATFIPGAATLTPTATFIPVTVTPTPPASPTATQVIPTTQPAVQDTPTATYTPTPTTEASSPNTSPTPSDGGSQSPNTFYFWPFAFLGMGLLTHKLLGHQL